MSGFFPSPPSTPALHRIMCTAAVIARPSPDGHTRRETCPAPARPAYSSTTRVLANRRRKFDTASSTKASNADVSFVQHASSESSVVACFDHHLTTGIHDHRRQRNGEQRFYLATSAPAISASTHEDACQFHELSEPYLHAARGYQRAPAGAISNVEFRRLWIHGGFTLAWYALHIPRMALPLMPSKAVKRRKATAAALPNNVPITPIQDSRPRPASRCSYSESGHLLRMYKLLAHRRGPMAPRSASDGAPSTTLPNASAPTPPSPTKRLIPLSHHYNPFGRVRSESLSAIVEDKGLAIYPSIAGDTRHRRRTVSLSALPRKALELRL
jgi:hypothetical protein